MSSVTDAPPRKASVSRQVGGWGPDWVAFYREVFEFEVNPGAIPSPEAQSDFDWVVMIPQGLTLKQTWAKCSEMFPCVSTYNDDDDLDSMVPKNDRTSAIAYAKRFRSRIEADEEHKNKSGDTLTDDKIRGITLLERIVLELWYFWKTGGGHLDLMNWTLCAGSRTSDGGVPRVSWRDCQFHLRWSPPGRSSDNFRTRSVV